nr:AcfA family outer membrane beta-barrel protein [Vibrio ichthyoenteri]
MELGYSQFDLEDDRSKFIGSDGTKKTEEEWEASVKSKQFSLASVYTHNLNDKWLAKVKAGLTYTQYDVNGSHYEETEYHASEVETIKPYSGYSDSSNEVGGLIAVGTEYKILPQLTVGANVK